MSRNDIKRLSRLIAIQIQLQTKRVVTAPELAEKFSVSTRTIYRDIKALEEAGIPIFTEEGKGYSLMHGYLIPPVMFTESEAYALVTAEQLVLGNKDASLIREFTEAISKIKAVLRQPIKEKANFLKERIIVRQSQDQKVSSKDLSHLQIAIMNSQLAKIEYIDEDANITTRIIEPFAFYNDRENWLLFAYCRLRNDFRAFRLDRIQMLRILDEKFEPQTMSLRQFLDKHYATPDI